MWASAVLVLSINSAEAQVSSITGAVKEPNEMLRAELTSELKRDLRRLVIAQEVYFADHSRYGRSLAVADSSKVVLEPAPGVTLTLLHVTDDRWTARAVHAWMPGTSCVVMVNDVPAALLPRTDRQRKLPFEDGVPVCDET